MARGKLIGIIFAVLLATSLGCQPKIKNTSYSVGKTVELMYAPVIPKHGMKRRGLMKGEPKKVAVYHLEHPENPNFFMRYFDINDDGKIDAKITVFDAKTPDAKGRLDYIRDNDLSYFHNKSEFSLLLEERSFYRNSPEAEFLQLEFDNIYKTQ